MSEEKPPFELIDVSEVKPEDVGTLSLRYVDGTPILVVSGGKAVPTSLMVVDGSGTTVAAYTAGPPPEKVKLSARNTDSEVAAAREIAYFFSATEVTTR